MTTQKTTSLSRSWHGAHAGRAVACLAATISLALGGCAAPIPESPEPTAVSSERAPETDSPTVPPEVEVNMRNIESPEQPQTPVEDLADDGAAGAAAAARHFEDLVTWALSSGDTADLAAMSDVSCGSCNELIASIEDAHASGYRIVTERTSDVAEPQVDQVDEGVWAVVLFEGPGGVAVLDSSTGEIAGTADVEEGIKSAVVTRESGTWTVLAYTS